ncbi:MAG: Hpt domain-containing protein [Burkholderiales bacterium]|jgi:HPt (histidine-containing phosphotransfer) domain-containing protein|nr:Hpt domain-containing protein [Burkholderiales bacterium]
MDTRTQSALTAEATLDVERALQFLGGDADVLRELLHTFMLEAPAELATFEAAIAGSRRETLLRYLHRLVPTLAIIATESLHRQARELYHAMQPPDTTPDGHLPACLALAQRMHALHDAILAQLSR